MDADNASRQFPFDILFMVYVVSLVMGLFHGILLKFMADYVFSGHSQ